MVSCADEKRDEKSKRANCCAQETCQAAHAHHVNAHGPVHELLHVEKLGAQVKAECRLGGEEEIRLQNILVKGSKCVKDKQVGLGIRHFLDLTLQVVSAARHCARLDEQRVVSRGKVGVQQLDQRQRCDDGLENAILGENVLLEMLLETEQ